MLSAGLSPPPHSKPPPAARPSDMTPRQDREPARPARRSVSRPPPRGAKRSQNAALGRNRAPWRPALPASQGIGAFEAIARAFAARPARVQAESLGAERRGPEQRVRLHPGGDPRRLPAPEVGEREVRPPRPSLGG